MTENRHRAVLLLGPTGSGKTPLGQLIEARGLGDAKCVHFDFGENLREVVARNRPDETISADDIEFLRGALASGALLEDDRFPLAERILRSFLARRRVEAETLVVLNGLPRHVGQAEAINAILDVRLVLCLECSGDSVVRRVAGNVGGDRNGRSDDRADDVRRKLAIFRRRTAPLVDRYRRQGVRIEVIPVGPATTAAEMWGLVSALAAATSAQRE